MCRAFIFNSRRLNRPERETVKLPGSPFSNKKIYLIVFTDVFLFPKYILRLKKKKCFPASNLNSKFYDGKTANLVNCLLYHFLSEDLKSIAHFIWLRRKPFYLLR